MQSAVEMLDDSALHKFTIDSDIISEVFINMY